MLMPMLYRYVSLNINYEDLVLAHQAYHYLGSTLVVIISLSHLEHFKLDANNDAVPYYATH
jgi:hypothetical protein